MEKPHGSFGVSFSYRLLLILSIMIVLAQSQDADVMNILRDAINGSTSLPQWSDSDFCKWSHVRCNSAKRVVSIQIGNLNLKGSLPKELSKLTELRRFECQSNGLTGAFPSLPTSLQNLIIYHNGFTSIPQDFFKGMSNLQKVRIDFNPFPRWNVTETLRDCVAIQTFSADKASFFGEIPDFFGAFPGLTTLSLRFNQFVGGLPSGLSGSSIEYLWVNGQEIKLNGTLAVLQNMTSLKLIWVNGNAFSGPIPDLSNHDQLFDVNLRDNQLTGPTPKFKTGVSVDMIEGTNQFCRNETGQPCSSMVNALLSVAEPLGYPLKFAQSWKGNDPCGGSTWLGIVCAGGNILAVNFQNMGLSGTISPSLASLTSVRRLLLDNNNLTGTIPSELTSMPLLQELDVSIYRLYGKDKPSAPLSAPDSDSGGNGKKNNSAVIVVVVVVIVVLLGVAIWGFIWFNRKCKHSGKSQGPTPILVEAGNMAIPLQVLRGVTNNFCEENILGRGGFSTVYRGESHDGTKIAVKRMESGMRGEKGLREFEAEIAVLTKARHKHLVALQGYCLDANERLLVYEYMPQGTLSRHLFSWKDEEGLKPLEWTRRLTIALDVARGVEYLHGLAQRNFIHRDLKPSNILLGDDMRAKVSDFGLVRLVPEDKTSIETRVAGTFGYLAPDQPEENIHLVTWFRRMLINNKDDAFQEAMIDPTIEVSDQETRSSLSIVAELAGHCCASEPYQRPDMGHAVNVLAPLVENWKPAEENSNDTISGIHLEMSLTLPRE
ncbi:receptor protein kinase TMK1-like [Senna tora]|uniref:non-specific serine/threonine protein kinase n=1 Tax=Senna tora TaxID=362788 RepID=A0A834SS01_9FABA|nr:receptor protein kinase TMK1-like [Senna tora]